MTSSAPRDAAAPPVRRRLSLNDPFVRAVLWQVAAALLLGLAAWYLVSNTMENLARQAVATGYGFLGMPAGFHVGEAPIPYSPTDTYGRAFLVGILNTLKVAAIGIVLATVLGVLLGIARLSGNWLVAKLSAGYVEVVRNVPLLLQLFLWYGLLTEALPGPRQALEPLPGIFLSNRGLKLPAPGEGGGWELALYALLAGIALTAALSAWSRRQQAATGRRLPMGAIGTGLVAGLPALVLLVLGAPLDVPELRGFNFAGGATLTPELSALLFGLVAYTAAFIGEIVRSGILAVPQGQTEAARALGLSGGQTMRLVVLPQALRVIVPPTTSQYLNLTKNSSLAVAIGYPDFVSIVNTTINQTGQALEGVAAVMAVYLTISIALSLLMNWYNARIALKER
ncbi:amino acid ABC transporter permease [Rhodocista pekingensis]|uniref:Amino acid ABC transporter permease n=1 Tax=Rhodocista pekingensis TaxID=201185 RepID=A0ABW2KR62_9PROT